MYKQLYTINILKQKKNMKLTNKKQKIYWYKGWQIERWHFEGDRPFWEAKPTMWIREQLREIDHKYKLRDLKFCPPKANEMPCGCKECTYTDAELETLDAKHKAKRKVSRDLYSMMVSRSTLKACKNRIDELEKLEFYTK